MANEKKTEETSASAAPAAAPAEKAEPKTLWVRAITGLDTHGEGVHDSLLFERDKQHPGGEAFIAGPLPVEVGMTARVRALLHDEKIEEVPADQVAAHQASRAQAGTLRALPQVQALIDREQALIAREAQVEAREAALAQREQAEKKPNA
jgi:hypothetical protein